LSPRERRTDGEHQQNLARYDLAIVVINPRRLVVDQIKPLIPVAVLAFATAPRHVVTTIGVERGPEGE
jgi:hypothetical protein